MTIKYNGKKYGALNIVDTNNGYVERINVESLCGNVMIKTFDRLWICRHGAPSYLIEEPEFWHSSSLNVYLDTELKSKNVQPDPCVIFSG